MVGLCADATVSLQVIMFMLGLSFVAAAGYYYWLQQRFELKEIH